MDEFRELYIIQNYLEGLMYYSINSYIMVRILVYVSADHVLIKW